MPARAADAHDRALELLAAASALREKGHTPMTPDEQPYFDEQFRQIHEKMDPSQFDSTWARGRALKMDQTIALAFQVSLEGQWVILPQK